jgi:hypothetical protein
VLGSGRQGGQDPVSQSKTNEMMLIIEALDRNKNDVTRPTPSAVLPRAHSGRSDEMTGALPAQLHSQAVVQAGLGRSPSPSSTPPSPGGAAASRSGSVQGGFYAIYPCIVCAFTGFTGFVYYVFAVGLGAFFTTFESFSASCRTAASAHESSTGCSADSEEEWEVCCGGGRRGDHG